MGFEIVVAARRLWVQARLSALVVGLATLLAGCATPETNGDEQVCGFFGLEAIAFDTWRGRANQGRAAPTIRGYLYEPVRIDRPERPSLLGYRLSVRKQEKATRTLLFLQGNAMRTDQLRHKLTYFADRGFDVFVFDYRGYGGSDGVPLLKPISLDQAEIAEFVVGQGYERAYLYGISIGGIFALGPHMPRDAFDAIVIDSAPAELPWYSFCPSEYDPIANVPGDASNMLVLSGGLDKIVPASDVAPLGDAVQSSGGVYVHQEAFGHPLSDGSRNTQERFAIVVEFFEGASGGVSR